MSSVVLPITAFALSLAVPVFGFAPLSYLEVEGNRSAQVTIVEVNNLQFGNGVSRTLTINSRRTGQGIPAGHPPPPPPPTHPIDSYLEDFVNAC